MAKPYPPVSVVFCQKFLIKWQAHVEKLRSNIAPQNCTAKLHRIISSKLVRMMGLQNLFDFKLLGIFYEIATIETQFMEV